MRKSLRERISAGKNAVMLPVLLKGIGNKPNKSYEQRRHARDKRRDRRQHLVKRVAVLDLGRSEPGMDVLFRCALPRCL